MPIDENLLPPRVRERLARVRAEIAQYDDEISELHEQRNELARQIDELRQRRLPVVLTQDAILETAADFLESVVFGGNGVEEIAMEPAVVDIPAAAPPPPPPPRPPMRQPKTLETILDFIRRAGGMGVNIEQLIRVGLADLENDTDMLLAAGVELAEDGRYRYMRPDDEAAHQWLLAKGDGGASFSEFHAVIGDDVKGNELLHRLIDNGRVRVGREKYVAVPSSL